MDKICIRGGAPLSGSIAVGGAKNAALTLLPCALLTDEPLTLRNLPRLADVEFVLSGPGLHREPSRALAHEILNADIWD